MRMQKKIAVQLHYIYEMKNAQEDLDDISFCNKIYIFQFFVHKKYIFRIICT
jgi:hypothetical protein